MALLTMPEVAKVLRVSTRTAYEIAQRPGFPVIRFSKYNYRVPSDALDLWIAEQLPESLRKAQQAHAEVQKRKSEWASLGGVGESAG